MASTATRARRNTAAKDLWAAYDHERWTITDMARQDEQDALQGDPGDNTPDEPTAAPEPALEPLRTPREPHGTVRLQITINGTPYTVRPLLNPAHGFRPAWRLKKGDGVTHELVSTEHGPECSCGDFVWRRDGTGVPCKHLAAAVACGLMDRHEGKPLSDCVPW